MSRVLVIAPDPPSRRAVVEALGAAGHTVDAAASAASGLERAAMLDSDVVVVDVPSFDRDGVALCRAIRSDRVAGMAAICVVSTDGGEAQRVAAFEAGVDDFVARPFSVRELVLRVRALARRRTRPVAQDSLQMGELRIDRAARRVFLRGVLVDLTRREFDVLACLAERAGRVQTREALIPQSAGKAPESTRAVDTVVKRLRKKLAGATVIRTVRGVGYKLE